MAQHKKILVIEDDEDVRFLIGASIKSSVSSDIEIDEFDNAEEALTQFHEKDYDLLITDFKLPGMDGLDLIKNIYEGSKRSDCPIIFISGFFTELESAKNSKYFHKLAFIDKPFEVGQLIMHVKMFLYEKELERVR